jgi:1-acyl-sn-glycerol-3-phosphate acyltransferase
LQQTTFLTRTYRITRIVIHTVVGIGITALVLPFTKKSWRLTLTRWWCKSLLNCFNIKVIAHGTLPDADTFNTMFVANHISWVDIHSINSIIPLRFIAKIEVESWPVFGYLVSKSGTLFINRNIRKDAARIIEMTTTSLADGDNVCFFPEGTTTDGTHILPFKSSIVQAAINTKAKICPVAIFYPLPDKKPNIEMAYAGETTMAESMLQVLNLKEPIVELQFLAPIDCEGLTRQAATKLAFETINAKLGLPVGPSHLNSLV